MKKYIVLIGILIGISATLKAQQVPILTQSQINPFLLNPAYAGNSNWATAFVHTRNMWTLMPDAPQQYYLTIDGAMNNSKMGLGLTIHSNIEPIIKNIGGLLSYRYKIRLAEHHFLSGGLSAGFLQNSLDFSKSIVSNEAELADFKGNWSTFNFDFNVGLLYQFKGLEVGAVIKQLPNTSFKYEHTTSEKSLIYRLIRHYEISATYNWRLNDDFAIKPLLLMQSTQGMPPFFMVNATLSYQDKYWIGGGYKLSSAYTIMAGMVLSERLVLGYNYDITANDNRAQFGSTHEIAVGYRFMRQSKKTTHSENAAKTNINKLYDITQRQSQDIDQLKQSNEEMKKRLEIQNEVIAKGGTASSLTEEQKRQLEECTQNRAFMDSLTAAYAVDVSELTDDDLKEAEYYMILAAYYKITDAKTFQKILERELNLETSITTSPNGKYYFVYSKQIKSKKEANTEIIRLTGMNISKYISGNLWIYKNE